MFAGKEYKRFFCVHVPVQPSVEPVQSSTMVQSISCAGVCHAASQQLHLKNSSPLLIIKIKKMIVLGKFLIFGGSVSESVCEVAPVLTHPGAMAAYTSLLY